MMNYFKELNDINVNQHTEKKANLTYLAWAWAWQELKLKFPKSYYTIYENQEGMFYHTDGKTCWVKTGVTVVNNEESIEHIEYLPVMDYKNKSIPLASVTSFDVNKAIQRSLTKAVARHGLGLYIYAGEDLPSVEDDIKATENDFISKANAKDLKTLIELKGKKLEDYLSPEKCKKMSLITKAEYANIVKKLSDK